MGFALSDMQLSSTAFASCTPIPAKHTGEGTDVSPALAWTKLPNDTRSLAVVMHDPDAPLVSHGTYGFVHWVLYNIPGKLTGLPEGTGEYTCGVNDFGNQAHNGPMPPPGHGIHHYFYWLLALNRELDLEAGLTLWQLLEKTEPHVLGMNRLIGTYQRR